MRVVSNFLRDSPFADRARVLPLEPLADALVVEAVQAGQNYESLLDFVLTLTDGTLLVLLAEVHGVCLCELTFGQGFDHGAGHRVDHVLIELQELLVLFLVLLSIRRVVV